MWARAQATRTNAYIHTHTHTYTHAFAAPEGAHTRAYVTFEFLLLRQRGKAAVVLNGVAEALAHFMMRLWAYDIKNKKINMIYMKIKVLLFWLKAATEPEMARGKQLPSPSVFSCMKCVLKYF